MWNCGRLPQAAEYLQRATREVAEPDDYFQLSRVTYNLKRYETSLDAFLDYISRWPELADEQDTPHVWALYHAHKNQPERQVRLFQAMFDARFDDPTADNSEMWFQLTRLYIDRGQIDNARLVAKRIIGPQQIVRMRIDRRFDSIVDRTGYGFDVPLQAKRAVEALRRKADARPRDLAVWVQLTYAMLDAGDNEGVAALTTQLLDASNGNNAANNKSKAYESLDSRLWLLNNRALARHRLGRTDEAIADLERAVVFDPKQGPNISQALNLGTLQCYSGQRRQAVESVSRVKDMSDYGKLVQTLVYLCAATQGDDRGEVASALAVMRRYAADRPDVLVEGLLWAGHVGEAERLYLLLLDDPAERADALLWAQTFRHAAPQPGRRAYDEALQMLLARPAVQAAIEKVGRVEWFEVYSSYGFD
jgi:tetratricopeptide (TPR) repeat protein